MDSFELRASDGEMVHCYVWNAPNPKAVVHIAHGMGEHARRYDRVAQTLNTAGYIVFANDHRGHGRTGEACLGYMGGDGWNRTLADAYELNQHIHSLHADLPLYLLGHSMGAMLAQQYITRYADSIDGVALSGSPGFKKGGRTIPTLIAKFERWRLGPSTTSPVLQNLLFGGSNKAFDGPGATGFEWLSRDADEVRKYVSDPHCGFVLATGSLIDLFAGSAITASQECVDKVPKTLPIYVFAGSEDPVHGERADIERMVQAYETRGVASLKCKFYEGGRHEMFNETNRGEVIGDLIAWLNERVGA